MSKLKDLESKLDLINEQIRTTQGEVKRAKDDADKAIIEAKPNAMEAVASESASMVLVAELKASGLIRAKESIADCITAEHKRIAKEEQDNIHKAKCEAVNLLADKLGVFEREMEKIGKSVLNLMKDKDLIQSDISSQHAKGIISWNIAHHVLEPLSINLQLMPTNGSIKKVIYNPSNIILGIEHKNSLRG
jgi:hypothetical protein